MHFVNLWSNKTDKNADDYDDNYYKKKRNPDR